MVREAVAGGKNGKGEGRWWMEKEFLEKEDSVYTRGWGLNIQVPGEKIHGMDYPMECELRRSKA